MRRPDVPPPLAATLQGHGIGFGDVRRAMDNQYTVSVKVIAEIANGTRRGNTNSRRRILTAVNALTKSNYSWQDLYGEPDIDSARQDATQGLKDPNASRQSLQPPLESLSLRPESAPGTSLGERLQSLIDQFARGRGILKAVPATLVNRIEDFVRWLVQQDLDVIGTVTEDGVLALETRLSSVVQLFVEVDRDGAVEAAISEAEIGVTALDVESVADLTPAMMEKIIGGA